MYKFITVSVQNIIWENRCLFTGYFKKDWLMFKIGKIHYNKQFSYSKSRSLSPFLSKKCRVSCSKPKPGLFMGLTITKFFIETYNTIALLCVKSGGIISSLFQNVTAFRRKES